MNAKMMARHVAHGMAPTALALAVCVLTMLAVASPVRAQQAADPMAPQRDRPNRSDSSDVSGRALEGAAADFARAWGESSPGALLGLMSQAGVRVQLEGAGRSGLSPRQAVASVGEFLRPYRRGGATVTRASVLDSSPDRGFAEVVWSAMAIGTADAMPTTLFVGMNRLDGAWKVDEIRILP